MKAYLGPYPQRWISDIYKHFIEWRYDKYNFEIEEDELDWIDGLVEKLEDFLQDVYNFTVNRYLDNKKRKIKVNLHYYDAWGVDETIAPIVLPLLYRVKENKQGAPYVDPMDVPFYMRPNGMDGYHTDNTWFERWEYVLDEMIWTFEQVGTDWEDQFYDDSDVPEDAGLFEGMEHIKVDHVRRQVHIIRMQEGFTLFGKYLQGLGD